LNPPEQSDRNNNKTQIRKDKQKDKEKEKPKDNKPKDNKQKQNNKNTINVRTKSDNIFPLLITNLDPKMEGQFEVKMEKVHMETPYMDTKVDAMIRQTLNG
jgi:hypothetical protein